MAGEVPEELEQADQDPARPIRGAGTLVVPETATAREHRVRDGKVRAAPGRDNPVAGLGAQGATEETDHPARQTSAVPILS